MYEEIMHGQMGDPPGTRRRYLYNVVGGPSFPYTLTRDVGGDSGGIRFGDIVVAENTDNDEAFDQQQDFFSDDMLTSGDEGIGFAQARRLKSKLRRNGRRLTEQGYAVEADAPYQCGDRGKIRISFKNPFGKKSLFGKAKKLVKKIKPLKVAAFVGSGILGSKLLSTGFNLAKGALNRGGQSEPVAVATESPVNVPVPAPTGAADAVGTPIPADIRQAMSAGISPVPAAASTASEDVASQVQDAETENTMEAGVAGAGFTMPNFSDPKVLLTLAALGIFAVTQLGGHKGRSRSRSRRRR